MDLQADNWNLIMTSFSDGGMDAWQYHSMGFGQGADRILCVDS
jgi:hypothetical protein